MALGFKDFLNVDYAPGMPDLIKKNAKKRKQDVGGGTNAEYSSTNPPRQEVDEALTATQRRARARLFKKYKSRIERGRERAKRKVASADILKKRARKQARNALLKKITKGMTKDELTFARRQEIEKRLETPAMKKKIDMMAKKLLPATRKAELERKRGGSKQ